MFLNAIFFSLFSFIFFIIGIFFNSFIFKNIFKIVYEKSFFFSIFSGVFYISAISLIANFFVGLQNSYYQFLLLLIVLVSLFFCQKFNYKIFILNLPLILLISPILNYMPAGYDAALYHIPHQVWIQNDKIIFGLSNVHNRFGLISIFSYVGANLWNSNIYDGLAFLQGIFFLIFFSFLFYLLSKKEKFLNGIVISTILSLPIWFRYIYPSFGLVDAAFGFIFYISFIVGVYLILKKKDEYDCYFVFLFLTSSLFSFMLKPSGIVIAPFVFFVLTYLCIKKKYSVKKILKFTILPTFLGSLWLLKNFINTGCLIYPVIYSCFNVSWLELSDINIINNAITNFGIRHFKLIDLSYLISFVHKNYLLILFFLIFFVGILRFKHKKKYPLLVFFLLIFNIFLYQSGVLKGFSYFSEHNSAEIVSHIIFKEAFTIFFVSINSAIISYYILYKNFIIIKIGKIVNIFPLIFLSIYFIIWFIKAPLPRLAYGYFILLSPCIFIVFHKKIKTKKTTNNSREEFFIKNGIYAIVLIYFVLQPMFHVYKDSNSIYKLLSYNQKKVEDIVVLKRNGYGYKPRDSVFCWNIYSCYPSEGNANDNTDVMLNYFKYNYKVFTKQY
jgi:hypothetical protein